MKFFIFFLKTALVFVEKELVFSMEMDSRVELLVGAVLKVHQEFHRIRFLVHLTYVR